VGSILAVAVVGFNGFSFVALAPLIAADLAGLKLYGWSFSTFFLAEIVGVVAAGQRADRHGPANPLLLSLALLGTGQIVGGLAPTMALLVVARALQGLGAGALIACVYTIVNRGYPDSLRPPMLAAISSAYVVPALVGPAAAGFVAETFTWRAVFYGLVPFLPAVGLLARPAFGLLAPTATPDAPHTRRRSNRLPAAILLAVGTGLFLAGLETRPALAGLLFACTGLSLAVPALRNLLPAGTLLARRGLPATVAARGLFVAVYFYTEAYLVMALVSLSGYEATTAGLAVSAGSLSWTAGSWLQERLDRRDGGRGRRARAVAGVTLMAAGTCVVAMPIVLAQTPTLALALAGWVPSGLGTGLAHAASTAVAFGHAPSGQEGGVSSSLLLAELFVPAVIIGTGGALVALGAAWGHETQVGLALAFGLGLASAALSLALVLRLPR